MIDYWPRHNYLDDFHALTIDHSMISGGEIKNSMWNGKHIRWLADAEKSMSCDLKLTRNNFSRFLSIWILLMTNVVSPIKYQGSLACSVTALFFWCKYVNDFAYPRRTFLENLLSETTKKKEHSQKFHEKHPPNLHPKVTRSWKVHTNPRRLRRSHNTQKKKRPRKTTDNFRFTSSRREPTKQTDLKTWIKFSLSRFLSVKMRQKRNTKNVFMLIVNECGEKKKVKIQLNG